MMPRLREWDFAPRIAAILSVGIILGVFGSVAGSASAEPQSGDRLDWESARLAGPKAVDCGRVPVRGNAKTANDCVLDAFSRKQPFRVRYDRQVIDVQVSYGLVGTPDGRVLEIQFDGDPSGGGGPAAATKVEHCPEPSNLRVSSRGTLTCFPDRLDSESARLAGGNALNCGRVPVHGNAKTANDCVLNAFSHNQPFRVRYDRMGIDSQVSSGLVGTPDGQVLEIQFDSDPSGGSGVGAVTYTNNCPKPTNLRVAFWGGLTCLSERER